MSTFTVERYNILSSHTTIYAVWEVENSHSTVMTKSGIWYGSVMTRPLPAHIDALPAGAERSEQCRLFWQQLEDLCYHAILAVFPDAKGDRWHGEIVRYDGPWPCETCMVELEEV